MGAYAHRAPAMVERRPFSTGLIAGVLHPFFPGRPSAITVGLASIIFSEQEAKRLVIEQIGMMTGSEGASVAGQVLANLGEIGRSARAVFVGITTVLVGSTAVFMNLQSALNTIWRVKPTPEGSKWRGFIRDRLRSFGIVLAVGFLLPCRWASVHSSAACRR